jgi:hypothetical protein
VETAGEYVENWRQPAAFERPVNGREASSGTLLNFRTLPQCLQRPLLVAPLGLSISQWCWQRVRRRRVPFGAVSRIASSPPFLGPRPSAHDSVMLT